MQKESMIGSYLCLSCLSLCSKDPLLDDWEGKFVLEPDLTLLYGFASKSWMLLIAFCSLVSFFCSLISFGSSLAVVASASMVIGIEADPRPSVCVCFLWS